MLHHGSFGDLVNRVEAVVPHDGGLVSFLDQRSGPSEILLQTFRLVTGAAAEEQLIAARWKYMRLSSDAGMVDALMPLSIMPSS